MKNFDQICRSIDWQKMAKARICVKNQAQKKKSLKYLADFLDLLSEIAVDVHGKKLSEVYPSAGIAGLIIKAKQQKN